MLKVCPSVQVNQKFNMGLVNHKPQTVDRRVFDMTELESEVRSLVSVMVPVLWKTRGFEENHTFSIRVDRRVFHIKEVESEVRSLVSSMVLWKTMNFP